MHTAFWPSLLLFLLVMPVTRVFAQGGDLPSASRGTITLELPARQGEPDVVTVSDAAGNALSGRSVQAVEAPGTVVERRLAIGTTDASGRSSWTPDRSGWVRLEAGPLPLLVFVTSSRSPVAALVLAFLIWLAWPAALIVRLVKSRG